MTRRKKHFAFVILTASGDLVATKFKLWSSLLICRPPHPQPLSQWERVAAGRVRGHLLKETGSSAV